MKYTDESSGDATTDEFIYQERLRHLESLHPTPTERITMGEEADRLIDNQLRGFMPRTVKTKSGYSRAGAKLAGVIASNTWISADAESALLCNVRFLSDSVVRICSVKESMPIGTAVVVDENWCARSLYFSADTTVFYEGFDNIDAHSNEHPSTAVTTDTTCSYCQQTGLHWSGKKGVNLCLRDSNGFKHDCGRSKVTINL